MAVSNSAASAARSVKNGTVNAHSVTSRMMKGTPSDRRHRLPTWRTSGSRTAPAPRRCRRTWPSPQVAAVGQGVLLGDHAAHGHAHQVEVADAERIDQRLRVVGEHPAGVGPGRLGAGPDAAVVEPEHPVAGAEEVVHLEGPGLQVVCQAVDQDDGLRAVALQLVVHVDVIDPGHGHWLSPPDRTRIRACSSVSMSSVSEKCRAARLAARSGSPAMTASASSGCWCTARCRTSGV